MTMLLGTFLQMCHLRQKSGFRAPGPLTSRTYQPCRLSRPTSMTTCTTERLPRAVYYVSPTGSDDNSGTLAEPFLTLAKGVSVLQPGDTLYVRGGTYVEALNNDIPGGTSWSAPVTVAAFPGEAAIIQAPVGAD